MRKRLYAIKHKPSGGFLPELSGQRAGYTYTEPVKPNESYGHPRLFETRGAARRALAWWLKGVTTVNVSITPSTAFGPEDYDEDWHTEEKPDRKAEDMEIVPVLLMELPNEDEDS